MFTTFAPELLEQLNRAFWTPRPQRRWFGCGGCLFWLILLAVFVGFYALKIGVYAVLAWLILVAQLVTWIVQAPYVLVKSLIQIRRGADVTGRKPAGPIESRAARRWENRKDQD